MIEPRKKNYYDSYAKHKGYITPSIGRKHIRRFEKEVWGPGRYSTEMSILEVGCGTGIVLACLYYKGVRKLIGIDHDPNLRSVIPNSVINYFKNTDIWEFLNDEANSGPAYDRVILFDVLEHFSPNDGKKLLSTLRKRLLPGGVIHIKVPNAGSPWGLQFQFGDLTHVTAYTPESLRQQAIAAGLQCRQAYPQSLGSPVRRIWQSVLNQILDKTLPTPPEIWEGNFYAILKIPE